MVCLCSTQVRTDLHPSLKHSSAAAAPLKISLRLIDVRMCSTVRTALPAPHATMRLATRLGAALYMCACAHAQPQKGAPAGDGRALLVLAVTGGYVYAAPTTHSHAQQARQLHNTHTTHTHWQHSLLNTSASGTVVPSPPHTALIQAPNDVTDRLGSIAATNTNNTTHTVCVDTCPSV